MNVVRLVHRLQPAPTTVQIADGRRVYVANGHAGTVSVLETTHHDLIATIRVGGRPWGIDVTPDGRYVYTANGGSNDVSVIDVRMNEVVATIPAGLRPWGVAISRR